MARQKHRKKGISTNAKGDGSASAPCIDYGKLEQEYMWVLEQSSHGNMKLLEEEHLLLCIPQLSKECNTTSKTIFNRIQDIKDKDGNNPLLLAASNGHLKLVQGFYQCGFNLQLINNQGDNALHLSAFQGHIETVQWLEQQGVSIFVEEEDGDEVEVSAWSHDAIQSIYFTLARNGDVDGLDKLVANVGRSTFQWDIADEYLYTALHVATHANQLNMVEYLCSKSTISLSASTNRRDNCLHIAAMEGHLALVEMFASKMDVFILNSQKWNALDVACFYGHLHVTIWLVHHTPLEITSKSIHLAVEGQQVEVLGWLLDNGMSASSVDPTSGDTPLHTAISLQNLLIFQILLEHHADLSTVDREGCTILQVIIGTDWLEGFNLLSRLHPSSIHEIQDEFLVYHAQVPLFERLYQQLETKKRQSIYQLAQKMGRQDLVDTMHLMHDRVAAQFIELSITEEKEMEQKPCQEPRLVPTSIEPPTRGEYNLATSSENTQDTPSMQVSNVLTLATSIDGTSIYIGSHCDWCDVLVRRVYKIDGMIERQFGLEIQRLELSSGEFHSQHLLRYIQSEEDENFMYILHENCTMTWKQAFMNPITLLSYIVTTSSIAHDIIQDAVKAMQFLHSNQRIHGSLSPDTLYLTTQCRTKLWVSPFTSRIINPSSNEGKLALATDVYDLGSTLVHVLTCNQTDASIVSYEANNLLERMTHVDPFERPTMDDIIAHPYFWSIAKRLDYIEKIANYVRLKPHDIPSLCSNWFTRLPPGFEIDTRTRHYDGEKFIDLVRWIRNIKQHVVEQPDSLWTAMQIHLSKPNVHTTINSKHELLGEFVGFCYPELIILLWEKIGNII